MSETALAYQELFTCWADDPSVEDYPFAHEHSADVDCDWGWACSGCHSRVDNKPFPTHAPSSVPGLRLVECQAEPRHWLFVHVRDDDGHGCPWCWYEQYAAELKPLKVAAERRRHRWCWLLNPAKRAAIRLGVARWRGCSGTHACWHVDARWRWTR